MNNLFRRFCIRTDELNPFISYLKNIEILLKYNFKYFNQIYGLNILIQICVKPDCFIVLLQQLLETNVLAPSTYKSVHKKTIVSRFLNEHYDTILTNNNAELALIKQ